MVGKFIILYLLIGCLTITLVFLSKKTAKSIMDAINDEVRNQFGIGFSSLPGYLSNFIVVGLLFVWVVEWPLIFVAGIHDLFFYIKSTVDRKIFQIKVKFKVKKMLKKLGLKSAEDINIECGSIDDL